MAARGPVVRGPAAQPGTARQPALVRGGRRARPRRRGARRGADGHRLSSLPRQFSAEQQRQITDWEVGKRWRTMPAGTIFPASLHYKLKLSWAPGVDVNLQLTAGRIGIARQATCRAATDAGRRDGARPQRLLGVLRATYTDGTKSYVVTVGVAVLPTTAQAAAALRELGDAPDVGGIAPGVRAVAFRDTPAAWFTDARRQLSAGHLGRLVRGALHRRLRRQPAEGAGLRRQLRGRGDDEPSAAAWPRRCWPRSARRWRRRTARGRPDAKRSRLRVA